MTEAERLRNTLADPAGLAEAAEEVRAWFVEVRGGAPFLSGADGALLSDWLRAGVPVPRILRAIESVAASRRAHRNRRPFTLRSCRTTLEGAPSARKPKRSAGRFVAAVETEPIRIAVAETAAAETGGQGLGLEAEGALMALRRSAVDRLLAVAEDLPDERLRVRCRVVREFHASVWAALESERRRLLDEAAAAMADLAADLDPEDFERMCEEHARQRVRDLFPELSVERICAEADLAVA